MTKSLLHILLASIVLSPCFADEITSRFDRIVPVKVPAWAPRTVVALGDIQVFQ